MPAPDTATALLEEARALVQERGFNAFSYKDLASAVGIRTASIHYHFPTKADLGRALIERYHAALETSLADLDRDLDDPAARLRAFVEAYRETSRGGRICLCGSLAADVQTLPETVRDGIERYLQASVAWVRRQVEHGIAEGSFRTEAPAEELSSALVAGLQGALVVLRAGGDASSLDHVERALFRQLGA